MDSELYKKITQFMMQYKGPSRELMKELKMKFPGIAPYTLGSIYSLHHQNKMKTCHHRVMERASEINNRFKLAIKEGQNSGIILRLAYELDVCPAILARIILEKYIEEKEGQVINKSKNNAKNKAKQRLGSLLKDTTLIEDGVIGYEIHLAIIRDDQYGPIPDNIKHCIGIEYEERLKNLVKELGIPFRDEVNLRSRGYDKTPDIKLEIPFAVDGFIVNWIESKALFADTKSHDQYMKSQYLSYWNRFGTGLVIYWFGYIDEVSNSTENKLIVRDSFPQNIILMDPSQVSSPKLPY